MSSLKMTFSLASLVLILGLVFATAPVMAQVIQTFGDGDDINPNHFAVAAAVDTFDATATDTTHGLPADVMDITAATLGNIDTDFRTKGGVLYTLIAPTSELRDGTDAIPPVLSNIAAKDVVISEIMWGIDRAVVFADRANQQFIELYNTVADSDSNDDATDPEAITTTGWILHKGVGKDGIFYNMAPGTKVFLAAPNGSLTEPDLAIAAAAAAAADKAEYIIVDQVGNVEVVGNWVVDIGQSGERMGDNASNLVSMYRNIDYAKVEKADHNADDAVNREEQLKGIPNGTVKGSWKASTELYGTRLIGTPGGKHFIKVSTSAVDSVSHSPVIINEIGNNTGDVRDWLELRNVSDGEVNLKKWQIGEIAGAAGSETTLVQFPDNDNHKIPAGGLLLIVNKDPNENDDVMVAPGDRINGGDGAKNGLNHRYYVDSNFKLHDTEKTLLVVRNRNDRKNRWEGIVDLTGTRKVSDDAYNTQLWPLRGRRIEGDNYGHGDIVKGADEDFRAGFAYKRRNAGRSTGKETWERVGWTGIGYKRNADVEAKNGGTPGYANGAIKNDGADAIASVMISEIMYATGPREATQWVELRNTSETIGVNVGNWRLYIVNHGEMMDDAGMMVDFEGEFNDHVDLSGTIPPGQSYLIVGRKTGREDTNLPSERIESAALKRTEVLLNSYGFELTLVAKRNADRSKEEMVDAVGNLMPAPAGARRADAQSFNDDVAWNLPDAVNDDGERVSVVRVPGSDSGMDENGWALYTMTQQYDDILDDTYYGLDTDIGSPGHHFGGVLPVSLSKFRPERMKDTGAVVVRWITESELNNAGFNILRSDTRDGEFTKLNTKLIAGQGTTSARTVYEYADTSAKPNVIYYYQIQDVSLDGQVQTLRTTHLRGNVTAAGKLTTTWAELKALQ